MTDHVHAQASLRCAAAKPNRLLRSSRDNRWTSLLVDHHEGRGRSDPFETHPTPDLTLVVALQGLHRLEVLKNGRWRAAIYEPGTAGLTSSLETARLRWSTQSAEHPFRSAHLYLPNGLVEEIADEYRTAGSPSPAEPLSSLAFHDPSVASLAASLVGAIEADAPNLYAETAARWLVTHLLSRNAAWRNAFERGRAPAALTDRRLARAIEYVDAHLGQSLAMDDLAREAGISVHHFARLFRRRTGLLPHAYLAGRRMSAACRLLRDSDLAVSEIGRRCGYAGAAAFAAAFRRHLGMSPTHYREEQGRNVTTERERDASPNRD